MNEFRFNHNNNIINQQNYPVKSNNNNVGYNINYFFFECKSMNFNSICLIIIIII